MAQNENPRIADALRVATFNIRHGLANDGPDAWPLRRHRTVAAIEALAPDLLGLQETYAFQAAYLAEALPRYRTIAVGRNDGREAGEAAAILFDPARLRLLRTDTLWFSDTPNVPGSKHWGNDNVRACTWAYFRDLRSERHFYHFNLHIDHESQPSREKSVALLLRRIAEMLPADPVIVTGDFNVGEENPVIRRMKESGFRDSYREVHPDAADVGTFSGFEETFGPDKIDYIFVSEGFDVREADIVKRKFDGRWPSDHAPVVATLTLER